MTAEPQSDPLSASPDGQQEIPFSGFLTGVCLVICAAGLGLLLWMVSFSDGLRMAGTESRNLERVATRMLGFESRLPELSVVEQMIFRLGGQDGQMQAQIREWYEEMVHDQSRPLDGLYLGVLYGEAGLTDQLRQFIGEWEMQKGRRAFFQQALAVGYIPDETPVANYDVLQARLAEEVPTNWFYFQLAQRLADQSGNRVLQAYLHSQFYELTDPPLRKWRVLMVGEMGVIGVGFIVLLRLGVARLMGKRRQNIIDVEKSRVPWTFREGTAILARGGALTLALIILVAFLPDGPGLLEHYGVVLLYLPPIVLASMWLCRPRKCKFLQVVGCVPVWPRVRSSLSLIVIVISVGLVGDWLIVIGGEALDISVHWTEWFVPQLVWGTPMELVKTATEFVVVAPLFEELIFRGLLFTTIRKKFSFLTSMVVSGVIFALAHGYGVVAFLTVLWSGFLWAWAYERTGSVIPGMIAHIVNNGLVVYTLVALFR